MLSFLLPATPKAPALHLPTHRVQETDNHRRLFYKGHTAPKPALDSLSSIPNRLQAQLDPGAI